MSRPAPVIPGRGGRPPPPADLSQREKEIWSACIEARPVGYFTPEVWPLLRAYAAHSINSEDIAVKLRENPTDKLRKAFRQETLALCTLSSKLRICKQGRRKHQSSEQAEIAKTPRRRLWLAHDNRHEKGSHSSSVRPLIRRQ
jgi:hypothetical protein